MKESLIENGKGGRTGNFADGHTHVEDRYYDIEEYQGKWNRWVSLTNHYLKEYEFGEFSACGQCWQETGIHGCFDLEYTKTYCNKLTQTLKDGLLDDRVKDIGLTQFRICECVRIFKKRPLIADMY